jgi:hypothetical protein
MDVLPLAHGTGHWVIDIGIYLGPFLAIVSVVMITDRRRQRREAREGGPDAPADGAQAAE